MTSKISDKLRTSIIELTLRNLPFEDFRRTNILKFLEENDVTEHQFDALYPDGLAQLAQDISDKFDREMLKALPSLKPEDIRIRDAVSLAVEKRLLSMAHHKEAMRVLTQFWVKPWTGLNASKAIWTTADIIWEWAGDTATDYNRYTKRTLLSGVLGSTYLYWLSEDDADLKKTRGFLSRRIENVMQIGKVMGRFKSKTKQKKAS